MTPHELQLMLINQKHDIILYLWEVKSKFGLFWSQTSSTLGHCSLMLGHDWPTGRWVDREKNKHCHRLCHSVPVVSVDYPQFTSGSGQTTSLNFSAHLCCLHPQAWGRWSLLSWWWCAWWWCRRTWSRRKISTCRGWDGHTHFRMFVLKHEWMLGLSREGALLSLLVVYRVGDSICEGTLCTGVCV